MACSDYDVNKDVYDENDDGFDLMEHHQQELDAMHAHVGRSMFEYLVNDSLHNYLNVDDIVDDLNDTHQKYIEVCLTFFLVSV